MNKAQLIDAVADKLEISRRAAGDAVDAVLDSVTGAVVDGDKVSLTGFGTFESTRRSARTARNPRTGEQVSVAAATVPKFRPGQAFKDDVNGSAGRRPAGKKTVKKVVAKKASPARTTGTAKSAAKKTAPAKSAAAKKTTAKRASAGKSVAKKTVTAKSAPAKKAATKSGSVAPAKKGTARPVARKSAAKAPATKAAAKKTTKKATAKKR
jgi:DNA-binding protein HU-beta